MNVEHRFFEVTVKEGEIASFVIPEGIYREYREKVDNFLVDNSKRYFSYPFLLEEMLTIVGPYMFYRDEEFLEKVSEISVPISESIKFIDKHIRISHAYLKGRDVEEELEND